MFPSLIWSNNDSWNNDSSEIVERKSELHLLEEAKKKKMKNQHKPGYWKDKTWKSNESIKLGFKKQKKINKQKCCFKILVIFNGMLNLGKQIW